jgi:hypothetical protein
MLYTNIRRISSGGPTPDQQVSIPVYTYIHVYILYCIIYEYEAQGQAQEEVWVTSVKLVLADACQ